MQDIRQVMRQSFSATQRINFLAVLLRLARKDDVSPAERDRMLPVLEWIGAGANEMTTAMKLADDSGVGLAQLLEGFGTEPERLLLFRESCSVVWVDGRVSPDEAEMLEHLALLLRIDELARTIIDSPLACSPEGERRFLEHLHSVWESI